MVKFHFQRGVFWLYHRVLAFSSISGRHCTPFFWTWLPPMLICPTYLDYANLIVKGAPTHIIPLPYQAFAYGLKSSTQFNLVQPRTIFQLDLQICWKDVRVFWCSTYTYHQHTYHTYAFDTFPRIMTIQYPINKPFGTPY